ncbi:Uu.00g063260.m01.CDS01 [Anthostomella pinea]|uniref:Uu.00g063260.m01.CDS01 n=1 Tax=Anthostomella pinea TaxID=933095 RepID=A0AAI8YN39_9PEZI|nr:Uu.00g063260.m01.CDS01 [Anthostomella pinea]
MCTEVWTRFLDSDCNHRQYQNTFACHIVRRCGPSDDQLLTEPVFLPAKPPKIPPGFLGCKLRVATKPEKGKCRECLKNELRAKRGIPATEATPPSTSSSSDVSTTQYLASPPSPDSKALERVRNSFIKISEQQRGTPQSTIRDRQASGGSKARVSLES